MIHDVAVLGGGIAGAVAALRLARGGARPLWIAAPRGDAFKPGEHLSAAALPLLKTLGSDAVLRAEVHRHAHSTYSAWGSDLLVERNAIVQLEGPPTVLDRGAFEDALTAQALSAGAERIGHDVTGLAVDSDHWLLETDSGPIAARFLFDATGRKALVASKHATRFQADRLGCQYGIFAAYGDHAPRPVTLIEAEERGWWYLSVFADGRAVVNFYADTDLPGFDTGDFEENARGTVAIAAYLSDHGYHRCGRARRIATNSTWIAPVIGAGWVAVGDAAAAFDPLSSHGMTTALWTAIHAADAYLAQDRDQMQRYAEHVARGVQDYLVARQAVYTREARWPDSPFWARRFAIPDAASAPFRAWSNPAQAPTQT
ncbi:glycine oxidase maturase GoxB [uncultured Tateyamaria sp.]|uniref:glycine oxidase maturase GoxB n=1 Tax=Tateyamaria sp. 1078 TaxID=3417464 RepID=UPI0026274414|nr:glycine oxidase maturase GoxB [uncultured Tateyamaria sp.]